MDKKDFKNSVKILYKIGIIGFIIMVIPIFILIYLISGDKSNSLFIYNVKNFVIALIYMMIFIGTLILMVNIFFKIRRKKETLITDKYIRELPKYFPPAIASFLLDMSLETTTDYTSTVAYLIAKKYIELNERGVTILNENIGNLSKHEKYVFNCITKKDTFEDEKFIKLVVSDAEEMGFIQKGKRKIHFFRNFGLTILVSGILSIISRKITQKGLLKNIIDICLLISEVLIFGVLAYSVFLASKYVNENFYRTKIGKEETLKWTGVKKYLKEYTLISDKNLKDIVIYEDYIPYAISLNEAKAVEKYIEQNESYRKLIYGRNE